MCRQAGLIFCSSAVNRACADTSVTSLPRPSVLHACQITDLDEILNPVVAAVRPGPGLFWQIYAQLL